MVSFSQLVAVKKDTVFGAARKTFSPPYFVTALVTLGSNTVCMVVYNQIMIF